jgi:propanediol dehydratase small subunit
MTDLSPTAQAVLDAAISAAESPDAEAVAAAALRAAADQVVPEDYSDAYDCCLVIIGEIREELLAIADELDPPSS